MNFTEYALIKDSEGFELPLACTISNFQNHCAVNGKISLPLEVVSAFYKRGEEIQVELPDGTIIGFLCLCKGSGVNLSSTTENLFSVVLQEVDKDFYGYPHNFANDYLVIDIAHYQDYEDNYKQSAPLWGGFIHKGTHEFKTAHMREIDKIVIKRELKLPSIFHKNISAYSIIQPYAFERYLRTYHLIELSFDKFVVDEIRKLGDDLKGVGQIFANFDKHEINRLKMIINNKCTDIDSIAKQLNILSSSPEYFNKAKLIFFEFGKESNPLKDKESHFDSLFVLGGFNYVNAELAKLCNNATDYNKLVLSTAIYWVYRVRCSIAHSKIGEYIMTDEDEEFVAEFAEPLINSIIHQVFQT